MNRGVRIRVNGKSREVAAGTLVAAAIAQADINHFRRSVNGQPRAPLCGMGVCMECRASIDGVQHVRTCQILCREGMEIRTDE